MDLSERSKIDRVHCPRIDVCIALGRVLIEPQERFAGDVQTGDGATKRLGERRSHFPWREFISRQLQNG